MIRYRTKLIHYYVIKINTHLIRVFAVLFGIADLHSLLSY